MVQDTSAVGMRIPSGKTEYVIYYRKPNGWLTWGDTRSGTKLIDNIGRGFQPMPQFGQITNEIINQSGKVERRVSVWHKILTHPDGPAQFPVEQIVTFRWYRPENVPDGLKVSFPQLKGHKVVEYKCPECTRDPFVGLDGSGGISSLAIHLTIMHKWDRLSLIGYGKEVGIDFQSVDAATVAVTEFDLGNDEDAGEDDDGLEIEEVAAPAVYECLETGCDYKGTKKQLAGHRMGAHKEAVPA